jgi:hypothetical protein
MKKDNIIEMATVEMLVNTAGLTSMNFDRNADSGTEKSLAAKALAMNPPKVIPTWIVDKKAVGFFVIFRMVMAFLSPSLDWTLSFVSLTEITAISAIAKKALDRISIICRNI